MKEYSVEDIKTIVRPRLGDEVPLVLFRILRIIGIRQILGETFGRNALHDGKTCR